MRTRRSTLLFYVLIILLGLMTALPNIFTPQQLASLPNWVPKQQITLGLDLKGGSYVVFEIDSEALTRERVQSLADDSASALQAAHIAVRSIKPDKNGIAVVLDRGEDADQAIRALRALALPLGGTGSSDIDVTRGSGTELRVSLSADGIRERAAAAAEQSLEIIRRRIDAIGIAEPTIQFVGSDRVLVQAPGLQDPQRIIDIVGTTAKLSFHMLPPPGTSPTRPGIELLRDADGTTYLVEQRIALSGDRLSDARSGFDPRTGEPVVTFRFDSAGAKRFADITRANVGKPFAIVLDDQVLSAPVIQEPIIGGSGQIAGRFTVQQTADLSALLRAGALPAPLTVVEQKTVGADLGSDAIKSGLTTGLLGFALVVSFMFALYGAWGLLANFALALNVALTFGALSLLGATLTLPGIAGIVLSIGLAVDANVLINERIREETRKGAGALAALDAGFRRAYSTIVDSNMTALIATALLFAFGVGPVRGFAVTMGLGIGISMFTAVSVVRVIMTALVRRLRLKVLRIEPLFRMKLVPDGTSIRFMRARFFGIGLSAILSLASIALFVHPGLNYGVDFKGGIQIEVETQGPANLADLRAGLEKLGLGENTLQEFGDASRVLLRVERQPGGDAAQTEAIAKLRTSIDSLSPGAKIQRAESVGPKVSGELAWAGGLSVAAASLAMLIYIWARFEWPFAVGAIATLILDVTKTVGFFALTGLDFNLTAIAALLTLIGYSVNDKVVVYDRMRENMRLFKQMSFRDLIDRSINETLGRSIYTSVTAFLALLPMAIWGGSAVNNFAVPMVFGIAVAATSSVFIAAPILLFLGDWRKQRRAKADAAAPERLFSGARSD